MAAVLMEGLNISGWTEDSQPNLPQDVFLTPSVFNDGGGVFPSLSCCVWCVSLSELLCLDSLRDYGLQLEKHQQSQAHRDPGGCS